MSLREYVLRRQGQMRDTIETLRLETLPLLNAWSEDTITLQDFFGPRGMSEEDKEELRSLRDRIDETGEIDDWSLVDEQLE